ncbi:hypothetical protein ATANTOWER_020137 [Ataeniobius toweri]|uniref:Uncharacterized protein n=1 Tax=Ataeniobius toweri TaxID=208326 RepID=A0ABU7CFF8_9TELE|nr:hypothetical protein [Ataeniobius toweri]
MDKERSPTAISTEQPDNENPDPPAPSSRTDCNTESENHSTNPTPFPGEDVAYTYTEPVILRVNGTPERLLDDDDKGDGCNTTPSDSITCE